VTGGYAGSALMRDLDHALRLIEATVAAVAVPVTLKMRLGWDDATRNAADLARRAEAAGVRLVTVHGRTRQQFYAGRADWDAVAPAAAAVTVPTIVNGDCATPDDARAMLARSGAAGVMIGRAALGRPWLPGAIGRALAGEAFAPPPRAARAEAAAEHLDSLLLRMGRDRGLRHARKHLAAYAADAGAPDAIARALVTTPDAALAGRLLAEAFAAGGDRCAA
jgi:nifR3 family TIM-barrel protein